jgi:CHASE2 domain-containing sensor protein
VKFKFSIGSEFRRSAAGAALATVCGLLLWMAPLGESWVNTSYDCLFRFEARPVTNDVVLVLMDNAAYDELHQERGQPWDRELHARLLRKLTADGCSLVVFDIFFHETNNPVTDQALADAMRENGRVVLMAKPVKVTHPDFIGTEPLLPAEPFLSAVGTNWGIAWLDPDSDLIVRRHWPFPTPGPYPSLAQSAARLAGAHLENESQEQWLRYYGAEGGWTSLSYAFALNQPSNYFRGKIVFIANSPNTTVPDNEPDKFRTPYTGGTGEAVGGARIIATAFLNLMNHDWLRRAPPWIEALLLIVAGILSSAGLCRFRPLSAGALAVAAAATVMLGGVLTSYYTDFWFPWLVITGGQVPCALGWALATQRARRSVESAKAPAARSELPETPDYELFHPAFGQGAYGKVWLARNAIGQWQALKAVYRANFGDSADPYEREFSGIKRYKPVSEKHPGLLRVDFVSNKKSEGYFYYVMELGDALAPGWEQDPTVYRPRDLASERSRMPGRRLPVRECLRIGLVLAEALEFLHQQGLTHRDIKPQNIIFANGQPKLADIGLIAEIRPADADGTYLGTPGYMPPPPEMPGTPQADIYALGMVLYTISTGSNPAYFPDLATTLVDPHGHREFLVLNTLILKACQPDCARRYASAAEMQAALKAALQALEQDVPSPKH